MANRAGNDPGSEHEIVDTLAGVYSERDRAQLLATRAGFPITQIPNFTTATVWWAKVVREIRCGVLPDGGLQQLLEIASREYPSNEQLAKYLETEVGSGGAPQTPVIHRRHGAPFTTSEGLLGEPRPIEAAGLAPPGQARVMLDRPLSSHFFDAVVEISLTRNDEDALVAVGNTNLPTGTKVHVQMRTRRTPALQTSKATVSDRHILSRGFITDDGPFPQDWYEITVFAYFNGPWKQPASVIEIVGEEGVHLAGPYAHPIDPKVEDSSVKLEAVFECIAPPPSSATPLAPEEITGAIDILRSTVIPRDDGRKTLSIGEGVDLFAEQLGKTEWATRLLAPGVVEVALEYTDNDGEKRAIWHVLPRVGSVRYRNSSARWMSRVYSSKDRATP